MPNGYILISAFTLEEIRKMSFDEFKLKVGMYQNGLFIQPPTCPNCGDSIVVYWDSFNDPMYGECSKCEKKFNLFFSNTYDRDSLSWNTSLFVK